MNPTPSQPLGKESMRVWYGWCSMTDKEVVREAAVKGLHVSLAITFLSSRKKMKLDEAEIWFKEEVIKWVHELLERRLIFKALQVLNNIGLNAATEFSKIFSATTDRNLRKYIGDHLMETKQLDEKFLHLWRFLNIILENSDLIIKYNLTESLECLDSLSDTSKSEIATVLFFKTQDVHLNSFLNGETLWKHLLINNDLSNLLTWINVRYKTNIEDITESNIIENFKKFHITNQMLDMVSSDDLKVSVNTRDKIYDEFSRFGMFQNEEKCDFIIILKRLKNSFSISNIFNILGATQSIVSIRSFIHLLIDYCIKRKHFSILNSCLKDFKLPVRKDIHELNLINEFRLLVDNFSELLLSKNIFNVSIMLSNDIYSYYNDNPLIFLSFLFFTKDVDIIDAMLTEKIVVNDLEMDGCLSSMLQQFKILKQICLNKVRKSSTHDLKVCGLIYIHLGIKDKSLFEFKHADHDLCQFYTKDIQSYGYSKKLDYTFNLKESRPSIAARCFILNELKTGNLKNYDTTRIEKKMCKLSLINFDSPHVCSSCVSFMEIIGLDSVKVRILTEVANILYKSKYDKETLLELLLNSEYEAYNIQNILESILMEEIESKISPTSFNLIEIFETYEIVIFYSRISNIRLPESFLKYCASHNLWLPFLLLAQIYEYPPDQIKLLIQFFKSPNMLEHLTHGVVNLIQIEEKNVLIRERDSRKYLLSKVGVRQSISSLNQYTNESIKSQSSLKSQSSFESSGSSGSFDLFEIDISNIKATVLQTLIRCHNSTDPPKALLQACQLYRNPLLAVFATSYEPDSLVTNWLTWLSVSCELCKVFTNYETTALSANSVTALLENCLKNRYPRTILEGFEIFLPENPLKIFMDFLNNCYKLNFNNTTLILKLDAFEAALKHCRKNSIINEIDHEMTYLNNKVWIEMTALRLLSALLEYNCSSSYEQILILEYLCNIKICKYFSCECPNFNNILSILKILYDSNCGVRLNISIMFDVKNSRQSIISCINELLEKQQYKVALRISQIENLPPDLIIVNEWQNKMNDRSDKNFWQICNETFNKHNVTADCVIEFYLHSSEKLTDLWEKFVLLKLAWEWAAKYELSCQHELEKKMWLAFLYLDEKHKNLDIFNIKGSIYLYRDLVETLKNITPYEGDLGKDFSLQLERIVSQVLNKNNFWLSLKLQKIFNCKSTDLETLKLCHSLAEGILLPHQLNTEQRLLLSNVQYLRSYSHRRTLLSAKFSSYSSASHSPANSLQTVDNIDSYNMNDTLATLKLLSEHLHAGKDIGQNVCVNYRISINIEIPYHIVVATTDYMKILKDALEDNCMNKLDVVHDFISAYDWSKQEIADFICLELVNTTTSYIDMNLDHLVMWDLDLDQDFQSILQFLQDSCSLLGYKIYSYANTLHKSQIESTQVFKSSDLALVIELLIRAHDCFTADCNMEGISIILKKSKEIVSNLLVLQDWKLMVRLLIGVARYTEMNYVFQIIKENDQFEFLLRKGFRKDNSLKVALLDYLKKYCPDNKDLYKIVALHFALFSEVAYLWEKEAQSVIKNLISISVLEMQNNKLNVEEEPFILLQSTESTKICLHKAMENYVHATEFHLQGEKLTKATCSAKQAELIALQLAFLKDISPNASVVCLLNLKNSQIADMISSRLSFEQVLLVVEAYNFHADWATVLYEQYVVKNNLTFFESFLKHLPLTDTFVNDISRKFVNCDTNTPNEIKCMKNILNRVKSLHIKYRTASELGFTDLVENLIVSGELVYLKDTVWKRGYKN